jgi:hypothetical protein
MKLRKGIDSIKSGEVASLKRGEDVSFNWWEKRAMNFEV